MEILNLHCYKKNNLATFKDRFKKKIEKRWSSVQNCEEHNNDERRLNISVRLYKANVETRKEKNTEVDNNDILYVAV